MGVYKNYSGLCEGRNLLGCYSVIIVDVHFSMKYLMVTAILVFCFDLCSLLGTVKPEIFACPLFREFRDLRKFAKITGRKYSNVNHLVHL